MDAPKALLVTGGGRGIGAATSRLAAAAGWRVAVNYVSDKAAADALVSEIAGRGGEAFAVRGDVGEEADLGLLTSTPLKPIPFYPIREPAVRLVAGWYQFLDAIGR